MSFARARLRHIRMKGKFARWTLTRRMLMARGKAVTAGSASPSDRNHSDDAHRTQNARPFADDGRGHARQRSEEHTSELQSLMRISSAVFCLKKKNKDQTIHHHR